MKCDELKPLKNIEVAYNVTTGKEQAIAEYSDGTCHGFASDEEVYLKKDVDAAIAELKQKLQDHCIHCPVKEQEDDVVAEKDKEIAELKKKLMPCLNGDCILTCEVVEKYGKENAELKQKLESVQASMYCDVVDANMEVRRLKRALYIVLARSFCCMRELAARNALYDDECKWDNFKTTCLKKAEEYK